MILGRIGAQAPLLRRNGAPEAAAAGRQPPTASPSADRRPCGPDTCVRLDRAGAILSAMSTESDRIPAKPTLDGLEDKWTQRWAKERVVQV